MKFTVITVTFNSAATIVDTVHSVLGQSHRPLEYIIVDGGSTDDTLEKLAPYRDQIASLVSEPDDGIYDAMNKGVARARGEVVGILNSDDFYADTRVLARVAEAFSDPAVDCVYGDLDYVDAIDTDRVVRAWRSQSYVPGAFRRGWHPAHPSFFVRRSVYERFGCFDTKLRIAADYEFMLRVLKRHQLKSVHVPEVFVKMRTGGASNASLKNIAKANLQCWKAWRQNGLGWSPLPVIRKPFTKLKQLRRGGASSEG
ncbi:glycosyltransferase family 2 protein [Coraliomargarita parva]|uniref:glycosyltransferase family 2 protein n=1 Tax=Coraliomargarita parva TaxID=3014050 RepID=UPI0022B2E936|nr:glycosyltransferase family 2 protein [Coraliomargarita parva]